LTQLDEITGNAILDADRQGGLLFAYHFSPMGLQAANSFKELAQLQKQEGFLWVHLDLESEVAVDWLESLEIDPEIAHVLCARVRRGQIRVDEEHIYGHLHDIRDHVGDHVLRASPMAFYATKNYFVTGEHEGLRALKNLQRNILQRKITPKDPADMICAFLGALNEMGDSLMSIFNQRLATVEAKVLQREGKGEREHLMAMRANALSLIRHISFKRVTMQEVVRDRPPIMSTSSFSRFKGQWELYGALIDEAQAFADQCQMLLYELRTQAEEDTGRTLYVLTVISALFLPGSLLGALWGMNVDDIPFQTGEHGFWLVSAIIVLLVALLVLLMRWLRIV